MPWYLVVGESGSGKTTSLSSAKLASPFADTARTSGISGTRNCDWWFLENAIVVDTAGRYTIPVNGEPDKEEWQKLLSLLVKYRRREPLNGLIVTVAADKLVGAGREALEEEGRTIRRRIDEMMRVLGVKSPSYVLVTKCDLIPGHEQLLRAAPGGEPQAAHGDDKPETLHGHRRLRGERHEHGQQAAAQHAPAASLPAGVQADRPGPAS